jgi:two-component system response regulator YesN
MFQVLLVDDEALARHDVKSMLDWEKHGFTICGEAYNGSMALALMERMTPHIVIMDVSMPIMNGVELSREIKERFPKVKMIMLSSFDDYDYVRTCLMNGAIDYLLKHRLQASALLTLLEKAVQELQSEEARTAQSKMIEHLSPVILREYVANVARDVVDASDVLQSYARNNQLYTNSVNYGSAAVQIVPFLLLTESLTDVQKNRLVLQAIEVMQMAIGDVQKQTVGYVGEGRFMVLFSSEERSEHASTTQMNQAMSALSHSLEKFLNLTCVYVIGPLCGNLRLVSSSYFNANQELNVQHDQILNASLLKDSPCMKEQKQLLLFLEQLDGERVSQFIKTIFIELRNQPVYGMTVQMIVSEMLHLVEMAWKRHNPQTALEDIEHIPTKAELGRMGSIKELEKWMLNYYACLLEAIKKQRVGGTYSRHITKALQFIADNYASNISLDITASSLNLNASYLSRLFKEEMQMTFTEYLNRHRIQTSCMLMESGKYALKQISSEVGFLSYTYFFKVFKSMTERTPQAYMDQLKQSKK